MGMNKKHRNYLWIYFIKMHLLSKIVYKIMTGREKSDRIVFKIEMCFY